MVWEHWGGPGSLQQLHYQPQWSISDTRMSDGVEGGGWGRNVVPTSPEQHPQGEPQTEYRKWAIPAPGEYYGGQAQMLDIPFKHSEKREEDGGRPGPDKGGPKAQTSMYPPQASQLQWQEYSLSNYPVKVEYPHEPRHP